MLHNICTYTSVFKIITIFMIITVSYIYISVFHTQSVTKYIDIYIIYILIVTSILTCLGNKAAVEVDCFF